MKYMILLVCFLFAVLLAIFFYSSKNFHVFQYYEKCVSLNAKPFSMFQYLNQTKHPIKLKVMVNALVLYCIGFLPMNE